MIDPIILHVFGDKWLPSKKLFYYLWTVNLTLPTTMICLSLINAHGKSRITMMFSLTWMIITIGLGTSLIFLLGIVGFGIANCLVNASMLFVFFKVKEFIQTNIFKPLLIAWAPALIAAIFPYLYHYYNRDSGLTGLIIIFLAYALIALPLYWLILRNRFKTIKEFFV
jgi:O-antigen/teichoic acid export membrane protein